MPSIISYLAGLGPWNWFIAAVLLLALETVVPGVHFLWFGIAASLVGLVAVLIAESGHAGAFGWPWQLVVFALFSIATVFWVRQRARPDQNLSDEPDLNVRGAQYVGRTFHVAETIRDGRGKIKVGDTLWPAEGPDAAVGTQVRVTGHSGTVLVVTPL